VPKGSFYSYFASKDAFAVEVLEDYWSWVIATFGPLLDDAGQPAGRRLVAFFQAMARDHEQHDYGRFCLVGSLALELAGSGATRAKVGEILERWQARLAACVADGRARGEITARRDPRETAELLVEAWEGAVLRSKVERTPHACHRFETITIPLLLA
jgi:TetR/AcrR family transcriptional regulator, transcriptional repressor for nem operon